MVTCIVTDLSYRFPIVTDMFPTDIFRSRYPVISVLFSRNRQVPTDIFRSQYSIISVLFSRPHFPFPLPFPTEKYRNRSGLEIFPTVFNPRDCEGGGVAGRLGIRECCGQPLNRRTRRSDGCRSLSADWRWA